MKMPCKCTECGVFFMVKPSHTKTRKCCSLECMTQLGIMEITPRISELESVGFVFNRERVRHENKQGRAINMCRYSIAQYPQGWKP